MLLIRLVHEGLPPWFPGRVEVVSLSLRSPSRTEKHGILPPRKVPCCFYSSGTIVSNTNFPAACTFFYKLFLRSHGPHLTRYVSVLAGADCCMLYFIHCCQNKQDLHSSFHSRDILYSNHGRIDSLRAYISNSEGVFFVSSTTSSIVL